jgi:heme/copper-type cytochrome/quinol oxidase subunit 3
MSTAPLAEGNTRSDVVGPEPPEVMERNLSVAAYMLAGASAFFFVAFLFGYFYLRSLNNAGMWKPKGVDGSIGWGSAVIACYVLSALLVRLGLTDYVAERRSAWRLKGLLALLVGLAGLVVEVLAWTHEPFGPADGGYASIYFGWTAFLFLFVLGTMFWLETTLATSYRYRNAAPDPHGAGEISDPVSLVRGELVALNFYWTFLAGIAVVAWIVLYLL